MCENIGLFKAKRIDNICRAANQVGVPVFMKDSLVPIVGEENMRREFPWDKNKCERRECLT